MVQVLDYLYNPLGEAPAWFPVRHLARGARFISVVISRPVGAPFPPQMRADDKMIDARQITYGWATHAVTGESAIRLNGPADLEVFRWGERVHEDPARHKPKVQGPS